MASSRSISPVTPIRANQQPHDEPLLITPTSSQGQNFNSTRIDRHSIPRREFSIPRRPVGGHADSSVTAGNTDEQVDAGNLDEQVGEGGTKSIPSNHQRSLSWRPLYFRKRIVISFAIIFTCLLAAVETLCQLSQRRHGLVLAEQRLTYLWTYGPTAVFTIVAAFWSRLEYQAKQSAPWSAIPKGPSTTSNSILLDYVSPLKPTAGTVAVNTTLLYPNLLIDQNNPPSPDESTASPSLAVLPILQYNIDGGYLPNITYGAGNDLDTFWSAAIFGVNGMLLEYLDNSANDQDVIDQIIHLHKLIRAQQFNNFTRVLSDNVSQVGAPIGASITDPDRLRVVQDATSTHILEGLLANMLLRDILAGILINTRKAVAKNPCSVAAVGSFLADSNLMDVLPESEAAEAMAANEKEMARRLGLLDKDVIFQLRWIREEGEGEGSIGRERLVYGIHMAPLEGRESSKIIKDSTPAALVVSTPETEAETMLYHGGGQISPHR